MKAYGEKRDYRKIDLYMFNKYECSTTWAKTCKEAKEVFCKRNKLDPISVKAKFSI